jgi:hypothetical protein
MKIKKILVACLCVFILSGCERDEFDSIVLVMQLWARNNGYVDQEGNIDYSRAVLDIMAGNQDSPPESGVQDSYSAVNKATRAEKYAQEGLAEGNLTKLENAMKLRPDEYRYQDMKAVLTYSIDDSWFDDSVKARPEGIEKDENLFVEYHANGHLNDFPEAAFKTADEQAMALGVEHRVRSLVLTRKYAFDDYTRLKATLKEDQIVERREVDIRYLYTVHYTKKLQASITQSPEDIQASKDALTMYNAAYNDYQRFLRDLYRIGSS